MRDDAVGVVALATLLVDPCQAKVGELELTSTVDKDVGSLDVAVDDALVVKVCKPREHLSTKRLQVRIGEHEVCLPQHATQIMVHVLNHHVHRAYT